MINVIIASNPVFPVNSYIIYNDNREACLVDPSYNFRIIENKLKEFNLDLKYVLLTHGHQDHIYSLEHFLDNYDVKCYMTKETNQYLRDSNLNLSVIGLQMGLNETVIIRDFNYIIDLDKIKILGQEVICHHLPGHSMGCTLFEFGDFILTGDFIFKGSIGRYDFPGSDISTLRESIKTFKDRFKSDNKKLYPGHNDQTYVFDELINNQMLNI